MPMVPQSPYLSALYISVLGRPIDPSGQAFFQAQLDSGVSYLTVQGEIASSAESQADIAAFYTADLGRPVDAGSLASWVSYLSTGGTQAATHMAIATSTEAANAVNAIYQADLGRPASAADMSGWEQSFSSGNSLSLLRSLVAPSGEAANAINATYQAVLGRPASIADITGWQANFAHGSSLTALRVAAAASPEAATAINNVYLNDLGRNASANEIMLQQQALANGNSIAGLINAALAGPEFAGDIAADYNAAGAGKAPTTVEVAADASHLRSGIPLQTVQAEIKELGGAAGPPTVASTAITPQTINVSASASAFVYGLLNNDALVAAAPETVSVGAAMGVATATITGFNAAQDIIQVQSSEAPSYAAIAVTPYGSGGSSLQLGSGHTVVLTNVAPPSLSAADFRFV